MCQSGNKDINEANKKFCSHEGYLLEGKRHSMKERKKKKRKKSHAMCHMVKEL